MRSFVLEDDSCFDEDGENEESEINQMKAKIRLEMIEKLAREWNEAHTRMEQRSFRCREDRDEEADYHADQAADRADAAFCEAEAKGLSEYDCKLAAETAMNAYYDEVKRKESELSLRLTVIEEMLGELGARMARPYEHWNEDEKYMEYMENRYEEDPRDWD